MNINTSHFYEDFIKELAPEFRNYGFEFVKSSQSFVREYNQGRQYLNIDKLSGGIEVVVNVKIVNLLVREIIQKVIDNKQSPHMATIWWHSNGYFKDYDKERFFITNSKEMAIGKRNVSELLQKFALPIFSKYSSIAGIDSLVNDNSEYPLMSNISHNTNTMLTIYTGLITAKLLNRDDFAEIERRNLSNLDRFDIRDKDACMDRFNAIDFDKYRSKISEV